MKNVNHPFLFIIIYFGFGYGILNYGLINGTAVALDLVLGVALYALIVYLFLTK